MVLAVIIRPIPLIPILVITTGLITHIVADPIIRTVTVHTVIMAGEAIIVGAELDRGVIGWEAGVAADTIGAAVVFVVDRVAVFVVDRVAVFVAGVAAANARKHARGHVYINEDLTR